MTGNPDSSGQVRRERDRTKRPSPTGTDAQLLARYRDVLRGELTATLDELAPASEAGLFGPNVKRRPLPDRIALVGLAERLAAAIARLGELDELDELPAPPAPRKGRRKLGAVGE